MKINSLFPSLLIHTLSLVRTPHAHHSVTPSLPTLLPSSHSPFPCNSNHSYPPIQSSNLTLPLTLPSTPYLHSSFHSPLPSSPPFHSFPPSFPSSTHSSPPFHSFLPLVSSKRLPSRSSGPSQRWGYSQAQR